MKKVLILFGRCSWQKSRPFDNKKYMYSYEYFYELCQKNNIQMYRASYQWYDYRKKIFKHAWIFRGSNGHWQKVQNIKPDLIYDKTSAAPRTYYCKELIAKNYPFFNNLEFTKLIDNKLWTGILFPQWSKKNFLIQGRTHLLTTLKKMGSEKIVSKPLDSSGGKNVLIGTRRELLKKLKNFSDKELRNSILQDFIDSSEGIPRITKGIHDLRVVLINETLVYAYYRKPAKGSLLANLAQGGTMSIVPTKKLPPSLSPIIRAVQELLACFRSKIYTIDFIFDTKGKPWIIELNSMPGMYFEKGQEKTREIFYKNLLRAFKKELALPH